MSLTVSIFCERYQNGFSPLITAANNNNLDLVKYLLEKNADVNHQNKVSSVILSEYFHIYTYYNPMERICSFVYDNNIYG